MENQTPEKRIIAVDSQILNNMETCYHKWYLYNLCNWRPKHKSKAFDKGTLVHEIFRSYYTAMKDGQSWPEMVKISIEHGHSLVPGFQLSLEEIQQVITTCTEYMNHYRGDRFTVLGIEEPFSYKFYEDDELIILYEGIVDLRIANEYDDNQPWDHKTTSRNDQVHSLNNQFIGYCRAHKAKRMVINRVGFQKTLPANEKFTRVMKSYSETFQNEWAEEAVHIIKMGILHFDMGIFPRTGLSGGCDGKYGPCMFSDVCSAERDAQEFKLKVEFDQTEEAWDPLARD